MNVEHLLEALDDALQERFCKIGLTLSEDISAISDIVLHVIAGCNEDVDAATQLILSIYGLTFVTAQRDAHLEAYVAAAAHVAKLEPPVLAAWTEELRLRRHDMQERFVDSYRKQLIELMKEQKGEL